MTHARTQIRNEIATELTGLTTTGPRVFKSRLYPFEDHELPGLCIITEEEEIEEEEIGAIERGLLVIVEGYDKLVAGLEDRLDLIAEEVETAVFADEMLGGLVNGIDLEGIDTESRVEGSQPVGVVKLNFRVHYMTYKGTPGTTI